MFSSTVSVSDVRSDVGLSTLGSTIHRFVCSAGIAILLAGCAYDGMYTRFLVPRMAVTEDQAGGSFGHHVRRSQAIWILADAFTGAGSVHLLQARTSGREM